MILIGKGIDFLWFFSIIFGMNCILNGEVIKMEIPEDGTNSYVNIFPREILNYTGKTLSKQDLNQIGKMDNLTDLIIENNRFNDTLLKEIPFKKLKNLKRLSLANNRLVLNENIQLFKGLENLMELNLESNLIGEGIMNLTFWNEFKSLKKIIFNNNNFKIIEMLPNIKSLKEIHLSNCTIDIIRKEAFTNVPALEYVHLNMNNISNLPEIEPGSLLNLKYIDLTSNSLKKLETCTFSSLPDLRFIYLDWNPLNEISTPTFSDLPNLYKVSMSNTDLLEIPAFSFVKCSKLQYLDISSSKIERISSELEIWESLINLNISGNNFCCDCHLKHLRTHMISKTDNAFCSTPKSLKGKNLMSLNPDLFVCRKNNRPNLGVSPLAAVFGSVMIVVVVGTLLLTVIYVRRKRQALKNENLLNESMQRPTLDGYTEDETFEGGFQFVKFSFI